MLKPLETVFCALIEHTEQIAVFGAAVKVQPEVVPVQVLISVHYRVLAVMAM